MFEWDGGPPKPTPRRFLTIEVKPILIQDGITPPSRYFSYYNFNSGRNYSTLFLMGLLLLRPRRWFGGNITPPIFYGRKITPHPGRNYSILFFMGVFLLHTYRWSCSGTSNSSSAQRTARSSRWGHTHHWVSLRPYRWSCSGTSNFSSPQRAARSSGRGRTNHCVGVVYGHTKSLCTCVMSSPEFGEIIPHSGASNFSLPRRTVRSSCHGPPIMVCMILIRDGFTPPSFLWDLFYLLFWVWWQTYSTPPTVVLNHEWSETLVAAMYDHMCDWVEHA